ncbi:C2H2-type zinc finger protein, partial [Acinetobacter baumannii]|uniref:C2H2-type zinc finger protein n=1 Tax=Acinetobacter baumannii TaxID=470 RepID=UPI0034D5A0E8
MNGQFLKYKCHICSKSFREKGRLIDHQFTHTRQKTYNCEICGILFGTRSTLAIHIKAHKDPEGFPFRCIICGKGVSTGTGLKIHMNTHKDK